MPGVTLNGQFLQLAGFDTGALDRFWDVFQRNIKRYEKRLVCHIDILNLGLLFLYPLSLSMGGTSRLVSGISLRQYAPNSDDLSNPFPLGIFCLNFYMCF